MARTIAIGDIHGCLKALTGCLDLIKPTKEDTLVFLGDYIDRGRKSKQVIDKLIELRDQCNVVTLVGNHEDMLLHAPDGGDDFRIWFINGGDATISCYKGHEQNSFENHQLDHPKELYQIIPHEHWQFFKECLPYYETDTHIFLHANYEPEVDAKDQNPNVYLWKHFNKTPAPHKSGKTVIVGHTPQQHYEILDKGHVICIDTWACGWGCLTAMDVDSKKLWQVDKIGAIITE